MAEEKKSTWTRVLEISAYGSLAVAGFVSTSWIDRFNGDIESISGIVSGHSVSLGQLIEHVARDKLAEQEHDRRCRETQHRLNTMSAELAGALARLGGTEKTLGRLQDEIAQDRKLYRQRDTFYREEVIPNMHTIQQQLNLQLQQGNLKK